MSSSTARLLVPFNLLQTRLTDFTRRVDYVVLTLIAFFPILLAFKFGVARSHPAWTYPSGGTLAHQDFAGYLMRINWSSLVILLPLALYIVRSTARRLFDLDRNPDKRIGIPNLLKSEQAAEAFRNLACDGRNLLAALTLTILIHIFDMWDEVACAWNAYRHRTVMLHPPLEWDWSRFYLHDPSDRHLLTQAVILLTFAYIVQFLIFFFEMSLIVLLLRHNVGYIQSIYRRKRDGTETASRLVLELRDRKKRFGLNALQPQFNSQITLLSIGAALSLLSRYSNANVTQMHVFIASLNDGKNWKPDVFFTKFVEAATALFPTIGQTLFVVYWILMFLIVFTPALAKLVPLWSYKDSNPSTQEFLLELIPPGSEIDCSTDGLSKDGSVEEFTTKFAANAFWPSGDKFAEYLSILAFVVFFFLIAPILPKHPYLLHLLYYALLVSFAVLASKFLFYIYRFRLRVVDELLAPEAK